MRTGRTGAARSAGSAVCLPTVCLPALCLLRYLFCDMPLAIRPSKYAIDIAPIAVCRRPPLYRYPFLPRTNGRLARGGPRTSAQINPLRSSFTSAFSNAS